MRQSAVVLTACLLLAGCSSSGLPDSHSSPSLQLRPSLPTPAALPRRTSAVAPAVCPLLNGEDFAAGTPNNRVTAIGSALEFQPGDAPGHPSLATSAYAVYSFDMSSFDGLPVLHCLWSSPPAPGSAWAGFANFSRQRWDWVALDNDGTAALPGLPDYIRGDSALYVTVLVSGSGNATLSQLFLGEPMLCDALAPPSSIEPNTAIHLNGGFVPGETITSWLWDVEGDGTFELNQAGSIDPIFNFGSGEFHPALQVQTAEGHSYSAATTVHVVSSPHTWAVTPVCTPGSADESYSFPQLCLLHGRPALGYIYSFAGNEITQAYKQVQIRQADSAIPASWLEPVTPDSMSLDVDDLYAMTEYGGRAAVLVHQVLTGNLVLCVSTDSMLGTWQTPVNFTSPGGFDRAADMAQIGSELAVANITAGGTLVLYNHSVKGDTSFMPGVLALQIDGSGGNELTELSLAEIGGRAAIACGISDGASSSIFFSRATDDSGEAPWEQEVYNHGSYYLNPCLARSNNLGYPMIAASDGSGSIYSYSTIFNGGTNLDWSVGDPVADTSRWIDLAPGGGGLPQCLVNQSAAGVSIGVNWIDGVVNSYEGIDGNALGMGDRCVVITSEGTPVVAYEDPTTKGIKVAVLQ